jgi:outer membrane receptor protein involved in Fe transport
LQGEFTPEQALQQLLADSGFSASFLDRKMVAIGKEREAASAARASSSPLPAASRSRIAAADTAAKTKTLRRNEDVGSGNEIEQVIVTARKRAERIQDVPLSITALSSVDIERRGAVSASDYLRGVPGVNQSSERNGSSIVIRGIETSPSNQNFSTGTTVATYFGETPTSNSAGLGGGSNVDLKLVDIERVEVLRGPQGTAFGSSSLGGTVRTIPAVPVLNRSEAKMSGSYSATADSGDNNYMIQAIGNVPLVQDKLAIRASAYLFDESGIYRNTAGSDASVRAAAASFGAQDAAVDEAEVGETQYVGGRASALFQATDRMRLSVTYVTQKTEIDGQPLANRPGYQQAILQVAPEHVYRGQKGGVNDTDIDLANGMLEYDLGWGDLLATFSHVQSGSLFVSSFSASGFVAPVSFDANSDHRERSAEVRLTTRLEGDWNFVGGLYAENLKDGYRETYYWHGTPALDIFAPGERFLGDGREHRELEQFAAFAEASWEFLPRFTLTGGVRAYDYERTNRVDRLGPIYGSASSTQVDGDANGTSFRGNLSFKPNENTHIYAGWSQGFRLGNPQPGLPAAFCDRNSDGVVDGLSYSLDQTRRFESDEVDNYELGAKFSMLDQRLTVAADVFRIDWTGVPFRVAAPQFPQGCGIAFNVNAGAAVSEGVEFQANFYITRAFRVDAGASTINAELSKDAPGGGGFDGDRLPGSPKFNANLGIQYEFDIAGHDAFVRADSIYVGSFYGNLQESANTRAGGYTKVDATARIELGNLNLGLFARNLTNVDDFTFRGINDLGQYFGYRPQPRTIGLQLGYTF